MVRQRSVQTCHPINLNLHLSQTTAAPTTVTAATLEPGQLRCGECEARDPNLVCGGEGACSCRRGTAWHARLQQCDLHHSVDCSEAAAVDLDLHIRETEAILARSPHPVPGNMDPDTLKTVYCNIIDRCS